MRILVTGGSGFMGSNFINYILNKYDDYKIINFDLNKSEYIEKFVSSNNYSDRYKFVQGTILDFDSLSGVINEVDFVINYAGATHVDHSIKNSDEYIKSNIIGISNILNLIKENSIKKFIQISTDEVYGSISTGTFSEDSPYLPNNPYSATKAAADLLIRSFYKTHGCPAIITHSCNVFGPNQHINKLIPLFITKLLSDKPVALYGDGKNIRYWMYVDDHVNAIDLLLHRGEIGKRYNIGTRNELTNLELTKMILKEFKKDESYLSFVEDRKGHDFRYALSWEPIKALGWNPTVSFSRGLSKTIAWYKENYN